MFVSSQRPLSYIARERMAKAAAEDRRADREDEGNVLKRRVRAEIMGAHQVGNDAARQWHLENDPVPGPRSVGGGRMHPSRVQQIADFIAAHGWSDDASEPVVPTPTLADAIEAATAEARQRLADAQRDYEAYEATKHDNLHEPIEQTVAGVEAVTPRRGRPPGPRFIVNEDADVLPE